MGLDMYLYAEKYIADWTEEGKEMSNYFYEITGKRVQSFKVEAGYWRKANAIHNWFVTNCQGGIDNCQNTFVSIEKLEQLLETVKVILNDNSKASELLPTTSGFFFGGTEYNDWYFEDLEETKNILEKILLTNEYDGYDFYYQSSW